MNQTNQRTLIYEKIECRGMLEELLEGMIDPSFRVLEDMFHNAKSKVDDTITSEEFYEIWWNFNENLTKEEFETILRDCDKSVDLEDRERVDYQDFIRILTLVNVEYRRRKELERQLAAAAALNV